jgi:hypothetical protein
MRAILASIFLLLSGSAFACCEMITPEDMTQSAELIVEGKLSDRKEGKDNTDTATLTVSKVIKGDKDVKTFTLRFRARDLNTATWTYNGTETGIWYLKKIDGKDEYQTFHPNCLTNFAGRDEKEKAAATAEAIKLAAAKAPAPLSAGFDK